MKVSLCDKIYLDVIKDDDMINIGNRIRELRKVKNLSGKELAGMIGVTQGFLSGIENGGKKCSIETLDAICIALNVSIASFFSTSDAKDSAKTDLLERINAYSGDLSEKNKERLELFKALPKENQKDWLDSLIIMTSENSYIGLTHDRLAQMIKDLPEENQKALAIIIQSLAAK